MFSFLNVACLSAVMAVPRHRRVTSLLVRQECGSAVECLAEAHSAEQNQTKNSKIGEFTEDDKQEGKGLVSSAGPAVDVVVEHNDLGHTKGVAGPDNGEHHEDERAENTFGAFDSLQHRSAMDLG